MQKVCKNCSVLAHHCYYYTYCIALYVWNKSISLVDVMCHMGRPGGGVKPAENQKLCEWAESW